MILDYWHHVHAVIGQAKRCVLTASSQHLPKGIEAWGKMASEDRIIVLFGSIREDYWQVNLPVFILHLADTSTSNALCEHHVSPGSGNKARHLSKTLGRVRAHNSGNWNTGTAPGTDAHPANGQARP